MACGCGKTKPTGTATTASSTPATPAQPAPIQPLDGEPMLVGASR